MQHDPRLTAGLRDIGPRALARLDQHLGIAGAGLRPEGIVVAPALPDQSEIGATGLAQDGKDFAAELLERIAFYQVHLIKGDTQ